MTHIIIKNIGPIKEVELDLNKINVFMGPQSSGKSTIAKIISYCSWYEKNTILGTRPNIDFYAELLEFHNLEDSYFCDESLIEYKSPNCHIVFKGVDKNNVSVDITVGPKTIFRNEKIEYIPAERNFVTIKGIGKYNETKDSALGFLYEWFDAKQDITKENKYILPLTSLNNTSYYYDKANDRDKIVLKDGTELLLRHVSSGLVSATPLLVVYNYVLNVIYQKKRIRPPFETVNVKDKIDSLNSEKLSNSFKEMQNNLKNLEEQGNITGEFLSNYVQEQFVKLLGFESDYNYTKVIIEEPELNLFPDTQRDLIYYLLSEITNSTKDHQLFITTHSPYILFALNNCMMGGLVKENIPQKERKFFSSYKSWISPKKVSIYEIHDGTLKPIQDKDGIIEDNYLNQAYKANSSEYMSLLNYYEEDEE